MILEALSIGLALLGQAPVATNGDTAKVALLQQNIGTVEAAARGAKSKSGDAQSSAAIEKKYAETATALDAWRIAALATTQKEWSSSRERIEDLSRAVARSCAEFGRDARAYPNGVPSGIDLMSCQGRLLGFSTPRRCLPAATRIRKSALQATCRCVPGARLTSHERAISYVAVQLYSSFALAIPPARFWPRRRSTIPRSGRQVHGVQRRQSSERQSPSAGAGNSAAKPHSNGRPPE